MRFEFAIKTFFSAQRVNHQSKFYYLNCKSAFPAVGIILDLSFAANTFNTSNHSLALKVTL